MSRKLTGAGLAGAARANALYGESTTLPNLDEIEIARIERNEHQPRQMFDDTALQDLATSLTEHGQRQPIEVCAIGGGRYRIVSGERRWRAAQLLGWKKIVAIIVDEKPDTAADEARLFELSLVENLQREDLDALETAHGLVRLQSEFGYTQEQLAKVSRLHRVDVSRLLGLMRLPQKVIDEYPNYRNRITKTAMWDLASVGDDGQILEYWELLKAGALSVQALRAAKRETKTASQTKVVPVTPANRAPVYARIATTVRQTVKDLETARAQGVALDDAQRRELVALHRRLGELLNG